jgi:hypothetical protein
MTIEFCKEWDNEWWYLTRVNNSAINDSWSKDMDTAKARYHQIVEGYNNKPEQTKVVLELTII